MNELIKKVGIRGQLRKVIKEYTNIKAGAIWVSPKLEESPGGRKYLTIKIYI